MFSKVLAKLQVKYPGIDAEALAEGFRQVVAHVKKGESFDIVAAAVADEPPYNFAADNLILAHQMYAAGDKEAAVHQVLAAFGTEDFDVLCKALNALNAQEDSKLISASLANASCDDPLMPYPIGRNLHPIDQQESNDWFQNENSDPAAISDREAVSRVVAEVANDGDNTTPPAGDESEQDDSESDNDSDDSDGDEDNEQGGDETSTLASLLASLTEPVNGLPVSQTAVDTSITPDVVANPPMMLNTEGDPRWVAPDEVPMTIEELLSCLPDDLPNAVLAKANRTIRQGNGSKASVKTAYYDIKAYLED